MKSMQARDMYEVILKSWIQGSGFQYTEDFDRIAEKCTAREYIESLESPLVLGENEDILIQIVQDGKVLSECWVSEI